MNAWLPHVCPGPVGLTAQGNGPIDAAFLFVISGPTVVSPAPRDLSVSSPSVPLRERIAIFWNAEDNGRLTHVPLAFDSGESDTFNESALGEEKYQHHR